MKQLTALLFITVFCISTACKETPMLFGENVWLTSPFDGAVSDTSIVEFNWSHTHGASYYSLKISTLEAEIILDTLVYNNSFKAYLQTGDYLWQVDASNYRSITSSDIYSLSIDPSYSPELNWDEKITILAPRDSSIYHWKSTVAFSWLKDDQAQGYEIQIAKPSFDEIEELVHSREYAIYTANTEIGLNRGEYEWRIRAYKYVNYMMDGKTYYDQKSYSQYSGTKFTVE